MMRVLPVFSILLLSLFVSCVVGAEVEDAAHTQVTLPGYREQIAEQLRYFSQSAYCSVDSVTEWTCPICKQATLSNFKLTHKFYDANTNTFGFAGLAPAAGENVIIFSFRGATPSAGRNWITDLNSERIAYPGLKGATVHKGFYYSYLSVARQVNLAAKSLLAQCQHCHVYVTGHSLGAAIATLAAADLYSLTPDLTLYTFGSPRVGDEAFATYFDKIVPDTYRIVHHKDLVPHIPQRFLGFSHVSQEIWYYGRSGNQFKQCNGGEDDSCSNSVNLHVNQHSIKDHAVYLDQPMGCRKRDLARMGLIFLEEDVSIDGLSMEDEEKTMSRLEKLRSKWSDEDVLLEVQAESERTYDKDDVLEAMADAADQHTALAGGVKVTPARVLDPLSRPSIVAMNNQFHKIQSQWSRLPASFNPKVQEETAEDRWNRLYPEPK